MTNNDRLVAWLENTVRQRYTGQVALVCLYGSYINGTEEHGSDVDCYFVPKTEEGLKLARTFLLDGVGYDIFPMGWERLEAIANLQTSQQPLVGDVQVLYADAPNDLARFKRIQQMLKTNLQDIDFRKKVAEQRFLRAFSRLPMEHYTLKESRLSSGGMLMDIAEGLAYERGDYYHRGLKTQFSDLLQLEDLPEGLGETYRTVVQSTTAEALHKTSLALLSKIDCPKSDPQPPAWPDAPNAGQDLAGLYEEISSTFGKIYRCATKNDPILAFLSAVCLQWELPWLDVLSSYDYHDLTTFAQRVRQEEAKLRQRIAQTGGRLKEYPDFEAFLQAQV